MKMAKASPDDIDKVIAFFRLAEEFFEYGTHTPENEDFEDDSIDLSDSDFVEKLRELWGGRFRAAGVDAAWCRVVMGYQVLIDNVCDPDADTLEWKPEYAETLGSA